MFILSRVCRFSISSLVYSRKAFKHRVCFKLKYNFLLLHSTPSISLSNRIMTRGNFLKIYKLCRKYYNLLFLRRVVYNVSNNDLFKTIFNSYYSFRDIDRALLWRIQQIDSIFSIRVQVTRKINKKKEGDIPDPYIYYITDIRRYLLVLTWLKGLIRLDRNLRQNKNIRMFDVLTNFLIAPPATHQITLLKLQVYHAKILQLYFE